MSLVLPGISGGTTTVHSAMFPLKQSDSYDTTVIRFINGYEQRWMNRLALGEFVLSYTQTHPTDRANLDAFVLSALASTLPWTFGLTVNGATTSFTNCLFDQDSFEWQENDSYPGFYDGSIKCRQIQTGGLPSPGSVSAFPTFGAGYTTGFPFVRTTRYDTNRVDLETGNRISQLILGIDSRPSRALNSWTLTLTTLSQADANVLQNHFISCGGQLATFSFTEPVAFAGLTAKTYTSVRYDMDALQLTYTDFGIISATVRLTEVFNGSWTA